MLKLFIGRLLAFLLTLLLVSCSSTETNPKDPADKTNKTTLVSAKLVGASSVFTSKATAEWIDAIGKSVTYDVHVSTFNNFIPSANTLNLNTSKNFSLIEGLVKDTTYYIAIVSKSGTKKVTSNYLSFTTAPHDPILKSGIEIKKSTSVVTDNKTTITNDVVNNNFIFSTTKDAQYLKKVTEVTVESDGSKTATVEKATLRDVYEDISFSTTIKMEQVTSSKTTKANSVNAMSSNITATSIQKDKYEWGSGLSMSSSNFINTSNSVKKFKTLNATTKANHTTKSLPKTAFSDEEGDEASYFKALVASGYSMSVGESIDQAITIQSLNKTYNYEFDGTSEDNDAKININKALCEANGGTFWDDKNEGINDDSECKNMPVKLCKIEASIDITNTPEGASNSNLPYIKVENNIPYIKWSPSEINVDSKKGDPYIGDIDIKTYAGVFCDRENENERDGKKTIISNVFTETNIDLNNIEFLATNPLPDGAISLSDDEKNIIFDKNGFKIINYFKADFSPKVGFDLTIKNGSIKKGEASIYSTLKLRDLLEVSIEKEGTHIFDPKPIYTKQFTKVFAAGPVPVVVIGRLRLMAVAEIEAKGALETKLDLSSILTMNVDITYNPNTEKWEVAKGKDLTYEIKAGGKGNAEATVTVRIIPSFELSVYDLIAAHTVLEPYIYSTLGIEGEINAQLKGTVGQSSESLKSASYQFSKLEAGAGMDFKVYVGAAFDVSNMPVTLAWPKDAVFAANKEILPLVNASFMNPKHSSFVKKYYEATNTYKKYEIFDKTRIVGIPDLNYNFQSDAVPPTNINSRAIKLVPVCDEVINPLFKNLKLGKEKYITCSEWKSEKITSNFDLIKENDYYWMVPKASENGEYKEISFRLVNNSSLKWARQYKTVEYEAINLSDNLPTYWTNRYNLSSSDGDYDDDGISDIDEFKNGTSPIVKNTSKPSISDIAPAQTLSVGVLINPISFENKGGGIDSCVSSPTLAKGLSISSTCEISGTPTTEQSETTYTITASNTKGESKASVSLEITTASITQVPQNLSAVSGDTQVGLSWNSVNEVDTYNVYYSTSSFAGLSGLSTIKSVSSTSTTITGLVNNTKYYFVVTAVNDGLESEKSNQVNETPKKETLSTSTSTLNDTGITWGGDYSSGNNTTCTSNGTINAPQDCNTGRDSKTINKIGGGEAGFDFARLKADGSVHIGNNYATSPWSCVKDNHTGLVWEVKTTDGSIHDKDKTYKWGGISAIGQNHPDKEGTYYDDWDVLVNGSNTEKLCGFNDWRVPKQEELRSIVHYGRNRPAIDVEYFPNTRHYKSSLFWTSSPFAGESFYSWYVSFYGGSDGFDDRDGTKRVRLVRTGE